ncbi:MAG: Pr6Pr family membrane protein [Propionicimonas sp.]
MSVRHLVVGLRLAVALLGVVAILATLIDTASRATINPFNFFGFFTIQSNIIWIVVLSITALVDLTGRTPSIPLLVCRAGATTYIILVGAIYNTLLAGLEGGVALAWANSVLHLVVPIYGLLDWVLIADRPGLRWKWIWVSLLYPVVWLIVVLIRGATDGWVPYPFLDPSLGYGVVATYCFGIAAVTIVTAAIVWAMSRLRIIKPAEAVTSASPS